MSDFLHNLAARALRRQEPVRPRLASRFEPPGGGPAALPGDPPDFETTVVEPAPDAPSTIRPDAPPVAPHAHTTPREPAAQAPPPAAPRRDDSAGEEARARVEFKPSPPAPPRARETAGKGPTPLSPSESGADAPQPPARTPSETIRPVEVVRQEQRPARAPETDARVSEASAGAWERVRELEGRVAALEASREREKGRRESLKPVTAAVTLAPRPAPPHTPAAAHASGRGPESVDEPPHVTVTIGRVDVRAVFPAAAEAPRPAAAPRRAATTLAQYLEKRERGRR